MLHVGLFGFAMQCDLGFWGWLEENVWAIFEMRLQHMLDLTFSQPQFSNTVEYHYGEALQFRIATELEQVLKVKLKFLLEIKCQAGFWKIP